MKKTFILKMLKWAWNIFEACSVTFFLFYLVLSRVLDIKIMGYVAFALCLLYPALFLISKKLQCNKQ
ncbi:hypothetical protein SAMN02910409_1226 [Prevotellaceae bacterium HUN156]|nr:hypothetical protein SAMN02910409_1226 [Prevotellaceae bacterium HUN156]